MGGGLYIKKLVSEFSNQGCLELRGLKGNELILIVFRIVSNKFKIFKTNLNILIEILTKIYNKKNAENFVNLEQFF